MTLWSNSFIKSQLFSKPEDKETRWQNHLHKWQIYQAVLGGSISLDEWNNLVPKQIDFLMKGIKEIKEMKADAIKIA